MQQLLLTSFFYCFQIDLSVLETARQCLVQETNVSSIPCPPLFFETPKHTVAYKTKRAAGTVPAMTYGRNDPRWDFTCVATWTCTVILAAVSPAETTEVLIDIILPELYQKRHAVHFWLLPETWVTPEKVCPPLPTDCISPRRYVLTSEGAMCWLKTDALPSTINYTAYITTLLEEIRSMLPSDICQHIRDNEIYSAFSKILSLA